MVQYPLDVLDEAHAQHLVGFIQNQGPDLVQLQRALVDVIHYPPWCADHDRGAAFQTAYLFAVIGTSINGQCLKSPDPVTEAFKRFGYLYGQFAGGRKAHGLWSTAIGIEIREDGQGEGSGFTGSCIGYAQEVAPSQQFRNGLLLDGGGRLVANCLDRLLYLGSQRQIRECEALVLD